MRRLRRLGVVLIACIGLITASGVALAQTDEDPVEVVDTEDTDADRNDTLFNFGYDLINRIFVWGLSELDGLYDCTLENGTLTATYGGAADDGRVPVEQLEGEEGIVSFPNRPPDEVADDLEPAEEPIEYSGADGECGVSGADVTGPNGQVNHGMFMRTFNLLWEGGPGRGCVVRHLAQSDLGKGDQQVRVGEGDEVEPVEAGDTGTIDFRTIEADCKRGRNGDDDVEDEAGTETAERRNGPPDHAGKPDHAGGPGQQGGPNRGGGSGSPGNSGSAPGHNK